MSEIDTNLPQVRVTEPQLQKMLDSLALVLKTWNGETGNELDTVITYRDLIEDTSIANRFNLAQASGTSGGIDTTTSGDLTIPPQLSTLVVAQGPTKNVIDWEGIDQGSYSYTEIWRHTSDDLGNATLNGTTNANVYADDVGTIAQQYFYWVRSISTGGTPGPFNATAGTAQTVSAVDTAHIADAAIVTAKIGDAQITSAKIGLLQAKTANIDTAAITNAKIGTAAVETANIKDANVDTLQLAGQAVTIPVSAYTAGTTTLGGIGSMVYGGTLTLQSVSITATGSGVPIQIIGSARCSQLFESGTGTYVDIKYIITRGATTIFDSALIANRGTSPVTSGLGIPHVFSFSLSDAPAAGTYTYAIKAVVTSNGSGSDYVIVDCNKRSLLLLETKR